MTAASDPMRLLHASPHLCGASFCRQCLRCGCHPIDWLVWDLHVAWQLNVRMRLFQPGLAFKAENPSGRILKLTATVKTPLIGMYGS